MLNPEANPAEVTRWVLHQNAVISKSTHVANMNLYDGMPWVSQKIAAMGKTIAGQLTIYNYNLGI